MFIRAWDRSHVTCEPHYKQGHAQTASVNPNIILMSWRTYSFQFFPWVFLTVSQALYNSVFLRLAKNCPLIPLVSWRFSTDYVKRHSEAINIYMDLPLSMETVGKRALNHIYQLTGLTLRAHIRDTIPTLTLQKSMQWNVIYYIIVKVLSSYIVG